MGRREIAIVVAQNTTPPPIVNMDRLSNPAILAVFLFVFIFISILSDTNPEFIVVGDKKTYPRLW
jgi:hypothetical protein